jgi:DNA-directed RNA polymerase specialized sigma24 family protein
MYWPPICSFIRRRGYAPADAKDLTQSFFAYFLKNKAYARTDRLHGKFRSFLLASVKNFLADNWDRNQISNSTSQSTLMVKPTIRE